MPFNKALLQLTMNLNANYLESSNSAKKRPQKGALHILKAVIYLS